MQTVGSAPNAAQYRQVVEKMMTLYVTHQNQRFVIAHDLNLVDVELVRSSVELVGEPGFAAQGGFVSGAAFTPAGTSFDEKHRAYSSTINTLYAINVDDEIATNQTTHSVVYGINGPNAIMHKTHLNHGWANVEIEGMTTPTDFLADMSTSDNRLQIFIPTDDGLLPARKTLQAGPATPMVLQNIRLEQQITVNTYFGGNGPTDKRIARFAQDYANENPDTLKNYDGTIKYFDATSPGSACLIPANMINCMVLQFKVTSRNQV